MIDDSMSCGNSYRFKSNALSQTIDVKKNGPASQMQPLGSLPTLPYGALARTAPS
jgi:hypothetical protein